MIQKRVFDLEKILKVGAFNQVRNLYFENYIYRECLEKDYNITYEDLKHYSIGEKIIYKDIRCIVFSIYPSGQPKIIAADSYSLFKEYMTWQDTILRSNDFLGTGWELPTYEDLKTIIDSVPNGKFDIIHHNNFPEPLMWSSTEYSETEVYSLHQSGIIVAVPKNSKCFFRLIRRFDE